MKIRIASFTRRGANLSLKLSCELRTQGDDVQAFTSQKYVQDTGLQPTGGIASWTREHFDQADALIFIGATGIAVRAIAPCLRSKLTDPAVVCMDEDGRFLVSLLSGHVGGANRLAQRLAKITGGQAVVSTATDVNGIISVDDWIARNGMAMRNPGAVRVLASALLDGDAIGFQSEFPYDDPLPKGLSLSADRPSGLYVGIHRIKPFAVTLTAIPRIVNLGIGCRKDISEEAIREAVNCVLEDADIYPESIRGAASIDLKANEQGLLDYCAHAGIGITFYDAKTLADVPGTFTSSDRVLRVTGVDNVCERAAVCAGGELIRAKTAHNGVTVALSQMQLKLNFEGES